MNEAIWSLKNEDEEAKKPRVRHTSRVVGMNQFEVEEIKSQHAKDSSQFKLNSQHFQINESILDSESSQGTYKDFKELKFDNNSSNGESKQDFIRYFEFEIQQVDEIKGQKNLTFIVIKDVTKLV